MISHEHRCIFLHIPRTGGTSIEMWLNDGIPVEPSEQHLLASQAKELYADYWDSYFKFSFVRHPVSRVLSCLAFPDEFGLTRHGGRHGDTIDFTEYLRRFRVVPPVLNATVILEHDFRYRLHPDPLNMTGKYKPDMIYGNMLDEPIDFIGRTEDMEEHTDLIRQILGVKEPFDNSYRYEVSVKRQSYDLDFSTSSIIRSLYRLDYERFGYDY